jgi:hypothetical protein
MWQDLEDAINDLNDSDAGWWPFLFLRPRPHERISSVRVALIAVLYGLPAGLLLCMALKGSEMQPHPLALVLVVLLAFFSFYRLTFAWCWNRRAARLVALKARTARFRSALGSQEED